MNQIFRAVNVTKREYISPWDITTGSTLRGWCSDNGAGLFPYLLRKNSSQGGGDIRFDATRYAGRWAGDEVYLVGHEDETRLYQRSHVEFVNIALGLVEEYNRFIRLKALRLKAPGQH